MFLGPGLCIPPRPEFRCGPIAGTSAGPRVVNKKLFVRSQPRCMAGSLSLRCEGKTAALKCLKITACTRCERAAQATDKDLWYDRSQFQRDLQKFKKIKLAAEIAARAFTKELNSGKPKESKVDIKCAACL